MKRQNGPGTGKMMIRNYIIPAFLFLLTAVACGKKDSEIPITPVPVSFTLKDWTVSGTSASPVLYNVPALPAIRLNFTAPVNRSSISSGMVLQSSAGATVSFTAAYTAADSTIIITPSAALSYLSRYTLSVSPALKSVSGGSLNGTSTISLQTKMDSSDKFSLLSDEDLLTKVQQQTFKYFYDFGHPVSGLARERSNGDNETVTSGGSGFGIMALVTGISRAFITRAEGLARMQKIVLFLKDKAVTVKGAFPHWLNGTTGAIIPFSANDNGADLVETSYLVEGLLCARQYFNGADAAETALRTDINTIYNRVEWDWFRKGGENALYWHYSADKGWAMNVKISGWNECLVTYILAAASPAHAIPKAVYDAGWARAGSIKNGGIFYGYTLPLGENGGGPLFFEHYSFTGINPTGLTDAYASYQTQAVNHTKINYEYCKANPKGWYGYSDQCWGLTASDIPGGYAASSPASDIGVIAPTAALSSFPYTPVESIKALKFFYYKLGDRIFKDYGFTDAFKLSDPWFASSYLAIDQGPIINMIENYRSGLLWNLFTACPEVKTGMRNLGFTAPYL